MKAKNWAASKIREAKAKRRYNKQTDGSRAISKKRLPITPMIPKTSSPAVLHAALHPELSIVVPVYNETGGIERLLLEWSAFLEEEIKDFELIVVNDGSTDGTGRLLDKIRQHEKRVRVIHQLNVGHSGAIKRGYEAARGTYVIQVDAGGRYEPIDALRLWEQRHTSQMVLGTRTHRLDSLLMRSLSFGLHHLLRLAFGLDVDDANIPFRLFRREALVRTLAQIRKPTRSLNLLLTVQMMREFPSGVKQIPVPYRPRAGQKRRTRLSTVSSNTLATLVEILRLKTGSLSGLRILWARRTQA